MTRDEAAHILTYGCKNKPIHSMDFACPQCKKAKEMGVAAFRREPELEAERDELIALHNKMEEWARDWKIFTDPIPGSYMEYGPSWEDFINALHGEMEFPEPQKDECSQFDKFNDYEPPTP